MRHFIPQSLIMAEPQLQHEVEPQLLNGDDLNEEREEADASESVKKKRRKKKRNKTTAPGKRHHFAGQRIVEKIAQKKKKFVSSSATRCRARTANMRDRRLFNLSEGISVQMSQLRAAAAGAEGAHLETGQSLKNGI